MGLRSKLLAPLVFLGVIFAAILHLFWLPQYVASETLDLQNRELAMMEVVATALIPPLLSGDLAQIHRTLDQLQQRENNWNTLRLKAADGSSLYPIVPLSPTPPGHNNEWLTLPIDFDGQQIGTLDLGIDINAMLARQLAPIRFLELLLLALLLGIIVLAAALQDRWIRRPLKKLADATSHIANGNYKTKLPKASARDEVGKLITTIDSMRSGLANRETSLSKQHALVSAISAAQSRFIRDADVMALFDKLLTDILSISDSEYGFIGEVLYRDDTPYLKTLSISNIAWDAESQKFYAEHAPQGLEFTNLDSLFGAAIKNGTTVIANDPATDPRSNGLPDGHPPLDAFLGIPFYRGDKVIGMFGIANRANGYDQALIDFLAPITATCTQIVEALKADRQREQAEQQLRERETRMRTIFENVVDGIITTNQKGVIETFNHAAENMFGYAAADVVGKNVSMLTPMGHRHQHDAYIKDYLKGRESKIMGAGREVEGIRKDGSAFPVDIAITEMWIGEDRYFCSIMRDITDRKKVDRMKNEFVSTVSHELRTPLTSIRGALGLVGSGKVGELPAKAQPLVDIAVKNCDRLIRLINDILDIEKIEANKMEFDVQSHDLVSLVNNAAEVNRVYATEHGANIVVSNGTPDVMVMVDEDRFTQVMTNLISNAAKYSPEGGTIRIATQSRNGGVRVSVSDEGPGIPEEFHKDIFSKFSQADGSDTRKRGGSGLGLSITRAIIENHGGQVSFETQDGKGTTFHVDLPEQAQTIAAADSKTEQQPGPGIMTARILVCEDDADVAHLLRLLLQAHGYVIDVAHSVGEAKALLATHEYAAMTLDLILPDQSGIDLFHDIRQNDKTRDLPVIVVSAVADREARQLSGDAIQVVDWIGKPVDEHRLISAVARSTRQSPAAPLHILHIEDESDVHEIVSNILGGTYKVSNARTLAEARQMLAGEHIDLVILDLGLPDGSGLLLLPELAENTPDLPVVLFSAADVDAKTASGVTATLVKSKTTNDILIDTIHKTITSHAGLAKEA